MCWGTRASKAVYQVRSRESTANGATTHSKHLNALCENGTKFNVAVLDALGFGKVEGTKNREDG